ncbi:hypothetical protein [Streptomyces sp. NPDC059491]|uniref:hypothetical protein n=1 Tax=Streptomyces sp. NPDC059491 TaxID=3346850 RepID=UPI0036D1F038
MDEGEDGRVEEVRALLGAWLPGVGPGDGDPLGGAVTGLDVPAATASEVADALARLLGTAAPDEVPEPGARLIARVLVVEEHPSAAGWTERQRRSVTELAAVLVARHGEEGVEALVRELRGERRGRG